MKGAIIDHVTFAWSSIYPAFFSLLKAELRLLITVVQRGHEVCVRARGAHRLNTFVRPRMEVVVVFSSGLLIG